MRSERGTDGGDLQLRRFGCGGGDGGVLMRRSGSQVHRLLPFVRQLQLDAAGGLLHP